MESVERDRERKVSLPRLARKKKFTSGEADATITLAEAPPENRSARHGYGCEAEGKVKVVAYDKESFPVFVIDISVELAEILPFAGA